MNIKRIICRCPKCGRFFALKKREITKMKEEKVKILKSVMQLNQRGEAEKVGDCYVNGRRVSYEIHYDCRHCGAKHVERIEKEIPEKK